MVVFYLCGNCDFKSLRRTRRHRAVQTYASTKSRNIAYIYPSYSIVLAVDAACLIPASFPAVTPVFQDGDPILLTHKKPSKPSRRRPYIEGPCVVEYGLDPTYHRNPNEKSSRIHEIGKNCLDWHSCLWAPGQRQQDSILISPPDTAVAFRRGS